MTYLTLQRQFVLAPLRFSLVGCFILIGWLCATLGLFLTSVQAQSVEQRFALSVSPATGYVTVKPGSAVIHTVVVRNTSSQAVTVVPRLVDFVADGKSGTPILENSSMFPYLANSQTVLAPITIAPEQQVSVPFSIQPPSTAPVQEYHLTILFEQQAPAADPGSSSLVPAVGSNLVVLVSSDKPDSFLKIMSLQRVHILDSLRPLSFVPLVENQGTAAAIASGSAVVKDWRGRPVATFPIYPDVILANTTRELRAAQPAAPLLPDDPAAVIATKLEPAPFTYYQPFLLGPYTVEFNLIESDSDGITTAVQTFRLFAFPFSMLLVLVLTAGVIIGLRWWQRSRTVKPVVPEK